MKPKLIITQIKELENYITLPHKIGTINIPGKISFDYEISVEGSGNFSAYVEDKKFDSQKLAMDILMGRIEIKGKGL